MKALDSMDGALLGTFLSSEIVPYRPIRFGSSALPDETGDIIGKTGGGR